MKLYITFYGYHFNILIVNLDNKKLLTDLTDLTASELLKVGNKMDFGAFNNFVESLSKCKGKIVVTGVGKSAIVGKKFVATLNSVSIPSVFLNCGDAFHGDIGMLSTDDSLIVISKGGNTKELIPICNIIAEKKIPIFLITNNSHCTLEVIADHIVLIDSQADFGGDNLIPSISFILQVLVCDSIVFAMMNHRDIPLNKFTENHPSGSIGHRYNNRVVNCAKLDNTISVQPHDALTLAINQVSKSRKGAVAVIKKDKIVGIITDGDIRRMLEKSSDITGITCNDVMSKNPKTIESDALAYTALDKMNNNKISQLVVIEGHKFLGLIHLHDLL